MSIFTLPRFMKKLDLLCHGRTHILPVKMHLIAESTSDRGLPMAVYACPYRDCNHREGWVQDVRTGGPRRLWSGNRNWRLF